MIFESFINTIRKNATLASKLVMPEWNVPAPWRAEQRIKFYKSHVYAAVDTIGDAVADIQFILKQGTPSAWKEVPAHPILDLLYNPSELFDKDSLLKLSMVHYELSGEVFWFLELNERGIPISIMPLIPHRMTVIPAGENEEGLIAGYQYRTESGTQIELKPEQVAYFRNPHPENPLRGISTLEAAALAVDTDTFAAEYNRNFFYNSAVPLGAFSTEGSLSDSQFGRLEAEIKSKYGSKEGKSHTPAVLEGGLKWLDVGLRQKDMDFLEQRKFSREEIFEVFKVPMSLVTSQDVNLANAEVGERQFAKRVVKKLDNRLVTFINKVILPLYNNPKLFLDFEDPTPENVEENRQVAQTGKDTESLSINEIRGLLGYDAVEGEDADKPIFSLPKPEAGGTVDLDIKPAKEKSGSGTNVTTVHMTTLNMIEQQVEAAVQQIIIKQREDKSNKKAAELAKATAKQDESEFIVFSEKEKGQIWKALDLRTQDYERIFQSELEEGFDAQERRVLNKVEQVGSSLKPENVMNMPAEAVAFVSLMVPLLTRILAAEGTRTLNFVGASDQVFDMQSKRIVRYLSDYGLRFIDWMNQTTKDSLIASLSEGIKAGEGVPQLSNRVTQVYTDVKGYRSERITRTEVGRAVSSARLEAFSQSKVVGSKEWLTARDKNVRDTHAAQEGDVRPNNKRFKNGCMAPRVCDSAGESINCRCDMLPVLKKDQKYFIPEYKSLLNVDVSPEYRYEVIKAFTDELNRLYYVSSNKKTALKWQPKSGIKSVFHLEHKHG